MNIEGTKQLLQRFHISPNRLLGQNFMIDPSVFPLLADYASLNKRDIVLDIGAGFGFLTGFLAEKCRTVIAIEKDPKLALVLQSLLKGIANVKILEGDALTITIPDFTKIIAIPPYYMSSRLLRWLLHRCFICAVLVVQKEFANRLVAKVGTDEYSWITVILNRSSKVELLDLIPNSSFYPKPAVDSVILRLSPWVVAPFEVKDQLLFERMVQFLFTQRNKKLCNAVLSFAKNSLELSKENVEELVCALPFQNQRVRTLSPINFGDLANVFC